MSGGSPVPQALLEHMRTKASEARVALSMLKSMDRDGIQGRDRKSAVARFRASASELSIRFDTISAMLPGEDLSWLAKFLGCEWRPSSRRLEILMPEKRP